MSLLLPHFQPTKTAGKIETKKYVGLQKCTNSGRSTTVADRRSESDRGNSDEVSTEGLKGGGPGKQERLRRLFFLRRSLPLRSLSGE